MKYRLICLFAFCAPLLAQEPNGNFVFLTPIQEATILARVQVRAQEVKKRIGDSFVAGEELITFDDRVMRAEFEKARRTVHKAVAELKAQRELFYQKVGALTDVIAAEANLAIAEADFAKAREQLEACHILAPFKGRVADVYLHPFEVPGPNERMISLLDDSKLIAKVLIDSDQLQTLSIGTKATLALKELHTTVEGAVYKIGAAIDPSSSTVKVEVLIPNPDGQLCAGMSGIIEFTPEEVR
ncbi:MAG: efflux RND transporter periplasmic adaptor subunit [Chlamydiia bacterium]|nr:efflux RND transporter periplasmic adaptor subunit [Chlamydiia bacterium]